MAGRAATAEVGRARRRPETERKGPRFSPEPFYGRGTSALPVVRLAINTDRGTTFPAGEFFLRLFVAGTEGVDGCQETARRRRAKRPARKRGQLATGTMRKKTWRGRDKTTGEFMDQIKAPAKTRFKASAAVAEWAGFPLSRWRSPSPVSLDWRFS
jgi:hypothetical protein